jgi:hypothetical protein
MVTDKCPKCGSETTFGYGLAGGGMGVYWLCLNDDCDYFHKEQDPPEDDDPGVLPSETGR